MPRFVFAGVNQKVRIDPAVTSDAVLGLGTTDLKTCVAVIIIGKKSNRISLTHHTTMTNPKSIETEANWVGEPFEITLVKNQAAVDKCSKELQERLGATSSNLADTEAEIIAFLRGLKWAKHIKQRFNSKNGTVVIQKDGTIKLDPIEGDLQCKSPQQDIRDAINFLNSTFNNTNNIVEPDFTYDGNIFTMAPQIGPILNLILNLTEAIINASHFEIDEKSILIALELIDKGYKNQGRPQGLKLDAMLNAPERKQAILLNFEVLLKNGAFKKQVFDAEVLGNFVEMPTSQNMKM